MNLFSLWGYVLEYIKSHDPQYYDTFYKEIFPLSMEGDTFSVSTKMPYLVGWIENMYKKKLEEIISEKTGAPVRLEIVVQSGSAPAETPANVPSAPSTEGSRAFQEKEEPSYGSTVLPDFMKNLPKDPKDIVLPDIKDYRPDPVEQNLFDSFPSARSPEPTRSFISNPVNKEYTFENFVHGNCNEMAFEASLAVAKSCLAPEMADSLYNPLFIYGPSGLGKTHLLHAICNFVQKERPDLSVLFVSSETFTNELIEAIQSGKNRNFREKYRNLDFLLIDDVQFFGGKKNSSTTEIFNTFNTLFDNKKHIILTSDRTPSDINELEERLQTRFSSGLIAHISPPDYEICSIILKKRAQKQGIDLPDDVVDYMAGHINTSVRELEGAYKKVIAYCKIKSIPVTLDAAREALIEMIPLDGRQELTIAKIIDTVCEYFGVRKDKLLGNGRPKNIVIPRQIAMYLCRIELNESYPSLRDHFKRKDHSTVLYACERVERDMEKNPETKKTIEILKRLLEKK